MESNIKAYKPKHNIRIITATSLFDGHDAAINIIRRILQNTGVEVIHMGHNRSVQEFVDAAIEEDVQGVAMSSYQGGHMEFFKFMVDLFKEKKASHIKIFGGGGGVIVPEEINELHKYGVTRIYSPEDGATLGLQGIINDMVEKMDFSTIYDHNLNYKKLDHKKLSYKNKEIIANFITATQEITPYQHKPNQHKIDRHDTSNKIQKKITQFKNATLKNNNKIPVIGITGTGGAGKSSLTDELILRLIHDFKDINIAVISCDPSRRKTGGALLGDRIRMNSLGSDRIYMRSLATRKAHREVPEALPEVIDIVKAAEFDLVIVETAGIGQGDSNIIDLADIALYVMTSEFGAPSQLEKIDMLDYADLIVVNKFEKRGGEDAIRDVRKQVQRNRNDFTTSLEDMPVFGTIASRFNDDGTTALYHAMIDKLSKKTNLKLKSSFPKTDKKTSSSQTIIIPPERVRYLSEISETVRNYHKRTKEQANLIRDKWHLEESIKLIEKNKNISDLINLFQKEIKNLSEGLDKESVNLVKNWNKIKQAYSKDDLVYQVRGCDIKVPLKVNSLSHTKIPRISLPQFKDPGEIYAWQRRENLPGYFPYTAGVFPMKRADEDPTRMFAGEGGPVRTNKRFKLLSENYDAKRLSTAFDSVTLYGKDPEKRPDIYGKIGTSGVSICTLDDAKTLFDGFNLCASNTSVSMTINGPAPIMLAMFMNTAIDQQLAIFKEKNNREPTADEYKKIKSFTFSNVRGTVQADILKEDQGQNTCIFSIDFALKMMGDIQQFFIDNYVRNFYSVSISGYHIAEAGANPITQLALTLSNGFTYVEYYLSRGMDIDTFAPNLSYFFSNGMDPEYTVIGRVARRIWSITMRDKYGASTASQKLKYHIQTSGRSLHSQDIQFNDIRTTLQALCAVYDNCNSLHTNAFDEAMTTPSAESVRRALAIQLIINKEWGLAKNENMNQGSFIVEELTELVEEAILTEFDSITQRGGVLGAMETGYQRSKIQEESIYYETLKHSGDLPIVGVNMFRDTEADFNELNSCIELARATDQEKDEQLKRLENFLQQNKNKSQTALLNLQKTAIENGNIFDELMETVKTCSLGQITEALYEVGGQYRRNM